MKFHLFDSCLHSFIFSTSVYHTICYLYCTSPFVTMFTLVATVRSRRWFSPINWRQVELHMKRALSRLAKWLHSVMRSRKFQSCFNAFHWSRKTWASEHVPQTSIKTGALPSFHTDRYNDEVKAESAAMLCFNGDQHCSSRWNVSPKVFTCFILPRSK
jgi:hypothetical protein